MQYPPKQIGLRHIDWVSLVLSTELPNISKSLVMYLAKFMNTDQDIAWPSQARMMAELSLSNGSVNNHLKILESEGWIIRQSGNSLKNTRYTISFPALIQDKLHQMEQISFNTPPDGLRTPSDGDRVLHQMETNNNINNKEIINSTTSSPKVSDQVPFQKIINLYHEMLPQLPKVEKLTTTRKGYIRQRFIEDLPELKNWENYFDYVSQSDFLMGRTQSTNGRPPFRASLEWLTKPANYAKVAEENYHGI